MEKDIEERVAELDKMTVRLKSETKELEKLDRELEEKRVERAELEKIRQRQGIVRFMCPTKGYVVSFGNDCWHCPDALSCPKYYELTNPEEETQD